MNKVKSICIMLMLVCLTSNAQNIGVDYYRLGDYELAKRYMERELAQNPVMANYYLGEIALAEGKSDEAKEYFTKGLNANSEDPFNRIGFIKLDLKNKSQEAVSSFLALQKKYRGNLDVAIAIGYAYLDNNLKENALIQSQDALKIDKRSPNANILAGDIAEASQNWGEAVEKYDMAVYFDPSCALAYVKSAKVYEYANWQTAVEKLKEIIRLQPDYIIAYRYLGKIYTSNGYYTPAIEAFKPFLEAGYYTLEDIVRYVTALYFNQQYEEAKKLVTEGLSIAPDHFVLNRLQMYIAANLRDTENGLKFADHFFSLKQKDSPEYLGKDHEMYAEILKDAKMLDKAFSEYQKAISMDNNAIHIYKEMANIASLEGEHGYAADLCQQYIDQAGDKVEALDYFQLGKYCYSAGNIRKTADTVRLTTLQSDESFIEKISANEQQKDSLLHNSAFFMEKASQYYLNKANESFDTVIQRIPDRYTGYLWKARSNSLLDPDSEIGLAKPHYEKTIEIILENGESSKIIHNTLIEAYSYLGYFYYVKNDKANTLLYWNKVLELDPQNVNAAAVLKTLK